MIIAIIVFMEQYTYLLLGLALLVPLAGLLCWRKDLAAKALQLGIAGGIAGVLSELFYFRDYWRPPSLFGVATLSIEDFIFGFAITALSFAAYPILARYRFRQNEGQNRTRLHIALFATSLMAMLVLNLGLGINSIFVSCGLFVAVALIILYIRKDLLKPAVFSVLVLGGFIVAVYLMLFDIVSPDFWDKYWLLANTRWGITVLGHLPLTELIWYFSWILLASISHPFGSGDSLSKLDK